MNNKKYEYAFFIFFSFDAEQFFAALCENLWLASCILIYINII